MRGSLCFFLLFYLFCKLHGGVVGMKMWYTLGGCGLFMYMKSKKRCLGKLNQHYFVVVVVIIITLACITSLTSIIMAVLADVLKVESN